MDIYTDGSCLGNPGPGGWAAHCEQFTICGGEGPQTTNNIMELTAVIRALRKCLDINVRQVKIFTDSKYVINGVSQWMSDWEKRGWKTSQGSEVKNKTHWKVFKKLIEQFLAIEWVWVKAHNGDYNNEKVDTLARKCAELIKDDTLKLD